MNADEQRRAWLRSRADEQPQRPDVSEYMRRERDVPTAAIAAVSVIALILAVAVIVGV